MIDVINISYNMNKNSMFIKEIHMVIKLFDKIIYKINLSQMIKTIKRIRSYNNMKTTCIKE